MTSVLIRGEMTRGGCHVMTEAEIGVIQLLAKEGQGLAVTIES